MSCGFTDCGRVDCETCRWSRPPYASPGRRSASVVEPMRDDAKADLKPGKVAAMAASGRHEWVSKRTHRTGPHR